ncbi:transient receptor potential cation channel subfamily V member 1-like [Genypterus blacodes]|uniref:transient receptor potential cation channel subfamily V member 1-like n=1 Tax=Genypterus blacodes TaxID=154954 RepID=UPI003F76C744
MDPNESAVSVPKEPAAAPQTFTRQKIFRATSEGDASKLDGLLDFLLAHDKKLTSPEFSDGKTALLNALLHLKNGKNDTIQVLLDIAEATGDLEKLVNTPYTDPYYKGQTALHVAIERRSFDHVKLLVEKGADMQAKATGRFFQYDAAGEGFYFGELPLSMAACTNQLDIVLFLLENPHRGVDVTDKDSRGNTVLHALAIIADNMEENTEEVTQIYDQILICHSKSVEAPGVDLEAIRNNQGLTPLKLTAKLGRVKLFKHLLQREFEDAATRPLSRKFTEWVYGPVHSSLYDTSFLDTNEPNSVLELLVFGSAIPNRPAMLRVEPLNSLLEQKWDKYAAKLFLINFLVYMTYMVIFTSVAFRREQGVPPFPVEGTVPGILHLSGELISLIGAAYFFYKGVISFVISPPNIKALYVDGYGEILYFLQGSILLISAAMYGCGLKHYIGPAVISLVLGWINTLHYSGGFKKLGIYHIMMQRMILGDFLRFLCIYAVFLFGFSAAILVLIEDAPHEHDEGWSSDLSIFSHLGETTLDLFGITIGMGTLHFPGHIACKDVFYFLLILYVILTHILLLTMLIAVMGRTVDRISTDSEDIWKLQRALAILNMERLLPRWLRTKLISRVAMTLRFGGGKQEPRKFFRVEEINWKKWRSDLSNVHREDPESNMMRLEMYGGNKRSELWNLQPLLGRLRGWNHTELINDP